jgi:hypothetical protein
MNKVGKELVFKETGLKPIFTLGFPISARGEDKPGFPMTA